MQQVVSNNLKNDINGEVKREPTKTCQINQYEKCCQIFVHVALLKKQNILENI